MDTFVNVSTCDFEGNKHTIFAAPDSPSNKIAIFGGNDSSTSSSDLPPSPESARDSHP